MTSIETDAPASSPAPAPVASGSSRARAGVLLAAVSAPIGAGALLVWLGFNAGGFFPGTVGFGAIAAGLALLVWLTTAQRPFEGASGALLIAVGALTLFAIWILASAGWSDSPARAIVEFDRSLLYVLLLLTAGLAAAGSVDRGASCGASRRARSSSAPPGSSPASRPTCGPSARRCAPTG